MMAQTQKVAQSLRLAQSDTNQKLPKSGPKLVPNWPTGSQGVKGWAYGIPGGQRELLMIFRAVKVIWIFGSARRRGGIQVSTRGPRGTTHWWFINIFGLFYLNMNISWFKLPFRNVVLNIKASDWKNIFLVVQQVPSLESVFRWNEMFSISSFMSTLVPFEHKFQVNISSISTQDSGQCYFYFKHFRYSYI